MTIVDAIIFVINSIGISYLAATTAMIDLLSSVVQFFCSRIRL